MGLTLERGLTVTHDPCNGAFHATTLLFGGRRRKGVAPPRGLISKPMDEQEQGSFCLFVVPRSKFCMH